MKKIHLLLLSCLSGVLFTIGWPVNGFPAFLFTAFIPLLIIEDFIFRNKEDFSKFSVFFYTYPAFLIWNVLTTWWIWNSTPVAALAWTLNAMFMSIVMNVFHLARRNVYQQNKGYLILIVLWITFEYIHLNWKFTWSWLNLGNGFATHYQWVQWYEYTGALGGTFWILLVNILVYKGLRNFQFKKSTIKTYFFRYSLALLLIIIPIAISYIIYYSYKEKNDPMKVIVVQPNLDPYSDQYDIPPLEVIDINMELAKTFIDEKPCLIVSPESTIQENIWEGNLQWSTTLKKLKDFVRDDPQLKIVIGASTRYRFKEGEKLSPASRFHKSGNFHYEVYNTAFFIESGDTFQIHHKSRLTPGVEYMPSWGFLGDMAIDLGGTIGTLGVEKESKPFVVDNNLKIAPLICYESVFGEFCGEYVRKGANVLFIITNDGWWGNTPGHKQHLSFASLRAVEFRRSIARSANTGISCFVNQQGDIQQLTNYWERTAISQDVNLNSDITFYARFGDYFGRISAFIGVIFLLLSIVLSIKKKKEISG